jgi:hypothetical protein
MPVRRRKAQAMLAGVSGAEGKASFIGALLRHDTVVVVEGFVDGDEKAE